MATNLNLTEGHFFISVDGNRLKQYSDSSVYLENGKEFSLEIFNPTTSKMLAKIKINGNYISTSGLVLKPGQRVFLERYFDIAKKFKFETYSVDNTSETIGAIANNGLVEVEFYKEHVPAAIPNYTYTTNTYVTPPNNWQFFGTCNAYNSIGLVGGIEGGVLSNYSKTTPISSNFDNIKTVNTSYVSQDSLNDSNISNNISSKNSLEFMNMDMDMKKRSGSEESIKGKLHKLSLEKRETGRIESGSNSSQSFSTDYATYNSWYSSKVSWKILPVSQKPIEVSDLKVFCGMCGAKKKKEQFKFCPNCGAKFE